MLTQIYIRDLATIEELHLHFHDGCTMITGETGAGKSIFIEALELALGGRSSPNIIRTGKEKAEISLSFDVSRFPKVTNLLKTLDLHQETAECIIRRIITHDGRSRCYVNGSPQTLQFVKELGEALFHLHGQFEQQVLFKTETQRDMLDRYGDHLSLANDVKHFAEVGKEEYLQINHYREQTLENENRKAYLRFQLDEFEKINLKTGEWEQLEAEHHRLTHAEELIQHLSAVLEQLTGNHPQNIIHILTHMRKSLEAAGKVETKAGDWLKVINTALIEVNYLAGDLQHYLDKMEIDPQRLQRVEERVSQIFNLSRKHKKLPQELAAFQAQLLDELNQLNKSEDLAALERQHQETRKKYTELAKELSKARKSAAEKLEKEITKTIRSLSLPYGEFKLGLEAYEKTEDEFSFYGNEKIVFLIKTNPDQALQPIAKVISGGELSRLSLATHLALASRTNIPTLVFDEVDTGLSGATAEKIGKLLRKLGESYQVFCITHQPQVAACGHHHLLAAKNVVKNSSHSSLSFLNAEEKMKEIARLLGGEKITQKTLAHAKEVLDGV